MFSRPAKVTPLNPVSKRRKEKERENSFRAGGQFSDPSVLGALRIDLLLLTHSLITVGEGTRDPEHERRSEVTLQRPVLLSLANRCVFGKEEKGFVHCTLRLRGSVLC